MIEKNKLYNNDCISGMRMIDDNSIDCILTDPPYLYIKNQKFDVSFDETLFFNESKRVLKKDGFIVLFGRGSSFYRWNTILYDLGFKFKEEIIWDKVFSSSPLLPVLRKHETISIHTKGKGKINSVKVDFRTVYKYDKKKVYDMVNRINSVFSNPINFQELKVFLEEGEKTYHKPGAKCFNVTVDKDVFSISRSVNSLQSLIKGCNERSIISEQTERFKYIHPTQKPVKLLERLLDLVTKEGDLVLDPFSGSASTGIASIKKQRNFIGFEIDTEYYTDANKRFNEYIEEAKHNLFHPLSILNK
jgi:site-specific DNA-methyltransferase (adenine-specific)